MAKECRQLLFNAQYVKNDTRIQDRQGTPARSASKTSLAKVPATCVQDVRIGYIQDVLVFETLRIIVKPMAGSVPPV